MRIARQALIIACAVALGYYMGMVRHKEIIDLPWYIDFPVFLGLWYLILKNVVREEFGVRGLEY